MAVARKQSLMPAKRAQRPDGQATRERLIEVAGQVFAERGYGETTSKLICERAGVPLASVNYHFGSRDGLYEAVLVAAHHQLVALDELMGLVQDIAEPEGKLRAVLGHLAGLATHARTPWGFRVLLRELIAPSAAIGGLIDKAVRPKAQFVRTLVADVMQLPPEHASVQRGVVFAILPSLTLMIVPKQAPAKLLPAVAEGGAALAEDMVRYVMAGLTAMAEAARQEAPGASQRGAVQAAQSRAGKTSAARAKAHRLNAGSRSRG